MGALAKPDDISITDTLSKTRDGKITRRLPRELATNGSVKGDTTALEDFAVDRDAPGRTNLSTRSGRSALGFDKSPS